VPGILNICTANRCRSPIAERLLRAALPPQVPVSSAGLRARWGEPIWPGAAVELERRGISPLGFDSYPLDGTLIAGADLVLTATRAHRDEVLSGSPDALRRTFTWRELAWLMEGVGTGEVPGGTVMERLRALPAAAAARRGLRAAPPPEEFDVLDPVELPPSAMPSAADQIERAVQGIVRVLL
jgi:protein-tyrosine phosphatase